MLDQVDERVDKVVSQPVDPASNRHDKPARPGVAEAMALLGSVGLLASGSMTWLDLGSERFSGFGMVSTGTALARTFSQAPPVWVIFSWYLVPLLAVVSWLLLFVKLDLRVLRLHLAIGLLAMVIPALFVGVGITIDRTSAGPIAGLLSATLVAAAPAVRGWTARTSA